MVPTDPASVGPVTGCYKPKRAVGMLPADPASVEAMTESYEPAEGLQLSVVGSTGTGPVETFAADVFS